MLSNTTLSRKLAIITSILAVLALGLLTLSVLRLRPADEVYARLLSREVPGQLYLARFNAVVAEVGRLAYSRVQEGDPRAAQALDRELGQARRQAQEHLTIVGALLPSHRAAIRQMETQTGQLFTCVDNAIAAVNARNPALARQWLRQRFDPFLLSLREQGRVLTERVRQTVESERAAANRRTNSLILGTLGGGAVAILVAAAALFFFGRLTIALPIQRLLETGEILAAGRTDVALRASYGQNEEGRLGRVLVAFRRLLGERAQLEADEKKASVSTQRMESRFKALMAGSPAAVIWTDNQGRIQQVNATAEQLLGFDAKELTGQALERLLAEVSRPDCAQLRQRALRGPAASSGELVLCRKDGSTFPAAVRIALASEPAVAAATVSLCYTLMELTSQRELSESLKTEQGRAQATLEAISEALLLVRGETVVSANKPAVALLGAASMEHVIGGKLADVLAAEQTGASGSVMPLAALLEQAEHTGIVRTPWTVLCGLATAPVELTLVPVLSSGPPELIVALRDLRPLQQAVEAREEAEAALRNTETVLIKAEEARQRTETATQEAELRSFALLETARVGMAILDLQGQVKQFNQRLCDLLGTDASQVRGAILESSVHPEDLASFQEAVKRVTSGKEEDANVEVRWVRADGSVRWSNTRLGAVRGLHGATKAVAASVLDLTESHQLDEELRNSQRLLNGVVDASELPLSVKDRQGRHLLVNRAWAQCFGVAPATAAGRTDPELLPQDVAQTLAADGQQAQQSGAIVTSEVAATLQGEPRRFRARTFPLRDATGGLTGTVTVLNDITLEGRLQDQTVALRLLEEDLKRAQAAAAAAEEARQSLEACVADRLRGRISRPVGIAALAHALDELLSAAAPAETSPGPAGQPEAITPPEPTVAQPPLGDRSAPAEAALVAAAGLVAEPPAEVAISQPEIDVPPPVMAESALPSVPSPDATGGMSPVPSATAPPASPEAAPGVPQKPQRSRKPRQRKTAQSELAIPGIEAAASPVAPEASSVAPQAGLELPGGAMAELPEVTGIDVADALGRLGTSFAAFQKVLVRFARQHRKTLASLREALEGDDPEAAREQAQLLAAAAGDVSAMVLRRLARTLELAIKDQIGNYDVLFGELAAEAGQVFEAIEALPGSGMAAGPADDSGTRSGS